MPPNVFLLTLSLLLAAPSHAKAHPNAPKKVAGYKLRPTDILHTVSNRVTAFYSYKDEHGQVQKTASVSNPLTVTVVTPQALARLKPAARPAKTR